MSLPRVGVPTQERGNEQNYMPGYEKGLRTVFLDLIGQLDFAINNARRVIKESEQTGSDNPSTRVHELVCYLQRLKKD